MKKLPTAIAVSAAAAVTLLAGCSTPSTTPTSPPPSSASSAGASGSPPSGSSTGKVNANTASAQELAAAFSAAGVANADRWAREVEEYRPYSGTDNWAHLRQELSKYNIDDDTFTKIISALEV